MKSMFPVMKALQQGLLLAVFVISSAPLQAHHSFAMFDSDNQIRLSGTITRFQWTNPHVYIQLDVEGENGEVDNWTIECANISILSRLKTGWAWNVLEPGDEVTVVVGPLRSGEPGALLKEVKLPDGRVLGNGGPAGKANISIEAD